MPPAKDTFRRQSSMMSGIVVCDKFEAHMFQKTRCKHCKRNAEAHTGWIAPPVEEKCQEVPIDARSDETCDGFEPHDLFPNLCTRCQKSCGRKRRA